MTTTQQYVTDALHNAITNLPQYVHDFRLKNNLDNEAALEQITKNVFERLLNIIQTSPETLTANSEQIRNLEYEIQFIKQLYASNRNDVNNNYRRYAAQLDRCNNRLTETRRELQAARQNLQSNTEHQNASELRAEIAAKTLQINTLAREKAELTLQLETAKKTFRQSTQSTQTTLQFRNDENIKELFRVIQQNNSSVSDMDIDQMMVKLREYLRQTLTLQSTVKKLQGDLNACQRANVDFEKFKVENAKLMQRHNKLSHEHNTIKTNMQIVVVARDELQYSLNTLTENYKQLAQRYSDVVAKNETLTAQYDTMQARLLDISSKYTMSSDDLVQCTSELNELRESCEKGASILKVSQEEYDRTKRNYESAKKKHMLAVTAYNELELKFTKSQDEYRRLEDRFAEIDQRLTIETASCVKSVAYEQGRVTERTTQLEKVTAELNDQSMKLRDLEVQLYERNIELVEAKQKMDAERSEMALVQEQMENDNAALKKDKISLRSKLTNIQSKYGLCEENYVLLQKSMATLQANYNKVNAENKELNDKLVAIEVELIDEKEKFKEDHDQLIQSVRTIFNKTLENLSDGDQKLIETEIQERTCQHNALKNQLKNALDKLNRSDNIDHLLTGIFDNDDADDEGNVGGGGDDDETLSMANNSNSSANNDTRTIVPHTEITFEMLPFNMFDKYGEDFNTKSSGSYSEVKGTTASMMSERTSGAGDPSNDSTFPTSALETSLSSSPQTGVKRMKRKINVREVFRCKNQRNIIDLDSSDSSRPAPSPQMSSINGDDADDVEFADDIEIADDVEIANISTASSSTLTADERGSDEEDKDATLKNDNDDDRMSAGTADASILSHLSDVTNRDTDKFTTSYT